LKVDVPANYELGRQVCTQGPHGPIEVQLPVDIKCGETFHCHLAPPPELKVVVPPGFTGSSLVFKLQDGSHISIPVPRGKRPGEVFYVTPPALMVWVPPGAKTGEYVSFSVRGGNGDNSKVEWFRARIPSHLQYGYFAARLPSPVVGSGNN